MRRVIVPFRLGETFRGGSSFSILAMFLGSMRLVHRQKSIWQH